MPDRSGKLDEEDIKKVRDWIDSHSGRGAICPISKDSNWAIADQVVAPVSYGVGGHKLGGELYPQVMVICTTCGYTMYFNTVLMGFFPQAEKENAK